MGRMPATKPAPSCQRAFQLSSRAVGFLICTPHRQESTCGAVAPHASLVEGQQRTHGQLTCGRLSEWCARGGCQEALSGGDEARPAAGGL